MRVISLKRLRDFWIGHPDAQQPLRRWYKIAAAANWQHLRDVRLDFPHADLVLTSSKRRVVVFNIAGNRYRLITAIHFDRRAAYALRVLTHAEYDREHWKDEL